MKSLYLLTEDGTDDLLYEALAEQITGLKFTPVPVRLRKGTGIGSVRASLSLVLAKLRNVMKESGACLIVAMDNDRAPSQISADALSGLERSRLQRWEQHQGDRREEIEAAIREHPHLDFPIAAAVPVEMLESWILLIASGGEAKDLPRFARNSLASARKFYHRDNPPPQLKDLCEEHSRAAGCADRTEWALQMITGSLNPDDLAHRSPSFALFRDELAIWPR